MPESTKVETKPAKDAKGAKEEEKNEMVKGFINHSYWARALKLFIHNKAKKKKKKETNQLVIY